MPEKIDNKSVFTLFEVTRSIQKTLAERYKSTFWVKAEMHKLNHYSQSGHCYPELVEKRDGKTIAELRSIIWRDDFIRINNLFKKVLKEPLKEGITVLFCAKISFDPKYGLTLIISDIDPSYSLGELEREKQLTIEKLKQQGVYDLNRNLALALLPKTIAIVSVNTSKGYSDFLKIVNENPYGFKFFHVLFPALLQGERAVESILNQLNRIQLVKHHFDAVAIIRGGGGDIGLSCYNDHSLAYAIAKFPIPVFTGIGHSTNETVSEMVAFKNAITPTELGDFLVRKFHNFYEPVLNAQRFITDKAKRSLADSRLELRNTIKYFSSVCRSTFMEHQHGINDLNKMMIRTVSSRLASEAELNRQITITFINTTTKLFLQSKQLLNQTAVVIRKDVLQSLLRSGGDVLQQKHRLKISVPILLRQNDREVMSLAKSVSQMDPINVLKRGYSITFHQGKLLKDIEQVTTGDVITTRLASGEIDSTVN